MWRPPWWCDRCRRDTQVLRSTVRLMPRLGQLRYGLSCGCIEVHTFPDHIVQRLIRLADDGIVRVDDVAPPIVDESDAPRISVSEALEAANDVDEWLAIQLGTR